MPAPGDELGPLALALVKRNVPDEPTETVARGMPLARTRSAVSASAAHAARVIARFSSIERACV